MPTSAPCCGAASDVTHMDVVLIFSCSSHAVNASESVVCVSSLYNVMLCCVVWSLIKCFHQHKHTSKFINTPVNPLVFFIEQWNFAVSVMKSCWKHPYDFFLNWGVRKAGIGPPLYTPCVRWNIIRSWNASDNKHVCKNIFSSTWTCGTTSSLVLQSDWSRSRDMSPTCANQNPAPAMTRILIENQ